MTGIRYNFPGFFNSEHRPRLIDVQASLLPRLFPEGRDPPINMSSFCLAIAPFDKDVIKLK